MKILVLTEDYPDNEGGIALMYIHTRNKYYSENGISVKVLNFRTKAGYIYDGIEVISQEEYKKDFEDYDLLVLHAANIKHHFVFLNKYGKNFKRFLFFYHGHEVLRINKVYSTPYNYVRRSKIKILFQDAYDTFKLKVWKTYLPRIADKSQFVFVSKWMYNEFLKWTKIPAHILEGKFFITYNCVGRKFECEKYCELREKEYDFVTIRGQLDGSKYAVDIINRLAFNSPDCKFLLVGKGHFFEFNEKAPNLEWREQTMSHDEIVDLLQRARFALMPTRTDAQGLMMCEMAAFGIPVITSDILVCHEVFDGFKNVYFIDNDNKELSLSEFKERESKCYKDVRYYMRNTVNKELQILLNLKE